MMNSKSMDRAIKSVDIEANVGSISCLTLSHIRLGNVVEFPQMNMVMSNSSNDIMKAKIADERIAGLINGKVISRNVMKGPAPKFIAAWSRLVS